MRLYIYAVPDRVNLDKQTRKKKYKKKWAPPGLEPGPHLLRSRLLWFFSRKMYFAPELRSQIYSRALYLYVYVNFICSKAELPYPVSRHFAYKMGEK